MIAKPSPHARTGGETPHDRRPRAAFFTLGCKLNQFETEQMREQLEALGFPTVPWGEQAEVYVVNSCTVTARADRDTRRLTRLARRLNPEAIVAVTGCYVEVGREALAQVEGVDLLVDNAAKATLGEKVLQLAAERGLTEQWGLPSAAPSLELFDHGPLVRRFSSHTRAFVKVQEGCDRACTYCIIHRARGPERSVPLERIRRQVEALSAAGHREIVLVGTRLGRYRDPGGEAKDLTELVIALAEMDCVGRLRLSSLESMEVGETLRSLLAEGGRVLTPQAPSLAGRGKLCRHLHLPLQSGSDRILQAMGRPYTAAQYAELVRGLAEDVPGLCVGADVIVGFPGETEEDFAQTLELVRSLPLSYLHVFTYSPRPGTPAAAMRDQVPPEERKARNHRLRQVGEEKSRVFMGSQLGQRLEVLTEGRVDEEMWEGISDNYVRLRYAGGPGVARGALVAVRARQAQGQRLLGTVEEQTEAGRRA